MNQSLSAAEYIEKQQIKRRTRRLILCVAAFYAILAAIFAYQVYGIDLAPQPGVPGERTYTLTFGNPSSIHGFLTWLGLTRTAGPDVLWQSCTQRGHMPLGIYQRADGASAVLCYGPDEEADPGVCANWGLEMINITERTITCLDRRPRA